MARHATLTNEALAALGTARLAKLVLDEAAGNAPFKKRVAAALASAKGPHAVAAIIDRRLAGLTRARGDVAWEKRKAFAADLRATLATITDELGPADPTAAGDRLARFLICAEGVFERVDDSSGHVQAIFHDAAGSLPALALQMSDADKLDLIERLMPALEDDEYGLIEAAVHGTIPLLPSDRLADLDARLAAAADQVGSSKGEPLPDWRRLGRRDRLLRARQAVADRDGDVDRYIALGRERPSGRQDNLAVAERLLTAGRAAEALDWVRRPKHPGLRAMTLADVADVTGGTDLLDRGRVRLEVRILTALGRKDAAQALRWRTFETSLDPEILHAYIGDLPDFEEFDVLERAFAHAEGHAQRYRALDFLLAWPRHDRAAKFVVAHREVWSGQHYGTLVPAAEALECDHPLAATVLYRALLGDILARARSPAYGHGARYLAKLDDLARDGLAGTDLIDHETYRAGLRRAHGRKAGFWSYVGGR